MKMKADSYRGMFGFTEAFNFHQNRCLWWNRYTTECQPTLQSFRYIAQKNTSPSRAHWRTVTAAMAFAAVKTTIERAFGKTLSDLIRGIRAHKEDETKYIVECIDEIKQELRSGNISVKANAVTKLAYLQMLGYDISWAAFNIVEVMSSTKFSFKRVGYLAASQSFGEGTDVLMLTTNLIRKDLNSGKLYDTSVALSGMSCFMTTDLARDLCTDILALTSSPKPYIRKKAVLLLYKVFLKHPEALRASFPRLREKLEDPDPGVQSAAVNVICELARKNPQNYLSLSPLFFKLMNTSTNNWVLIKIIKLFGALTPLEPRLGKKLIEPLTNLIHSTSAMSLLYECINTVLAGVPDDNASIQLCVQKLRILIEDSDQNLKYLGLLAMNKILKHHPRSVQTHNDLILNCLEDKDESIRLRALDLLHGMVTKKNLIEIVKNLVRHLNSPNTSAHFRSELVSTIIKICSQDNYCYIASFQWYVSVLVELAQLNENKNGELISNQLLDVTVRVAAVRAFAVSQMDILLRTFKTMTNDSRRSRMHEVIYAAAWICGEFSSFLEEPQTTLEAMLDDASLSNLRGHIQSVLVLNVLKLYCKVTAKWFAEAIGVDDFHGEEPFNLNNSAVETVDVPDLLDRFLDLTNGLLEKMTLFVHSADLEVQERAVSIHQLLRLVAKRLSKLRVQVCAPAEKPVLDIVDITTAAPAFDLLSLGEEGTQPPAGGKNTMKDAPESGALPSSDLVRNTLSALQALVAELCLLFAGELNPVAAKAQRKVPVPEGLDLDAWINEPPPLPQPLTPAGNPSSSLKSSPSSKSKTRTKGDVSLPAKNTGNAIFGGLLEPESRPKVQLSEVDLERLRKERLQMQEANPHYLKSKDSSGQSLSSTADPAPSPSCTESPTSSRSAVPRLISSDRLAMELQKEFRRLETKKTKNSGQRNKGGLQRVSKSAADLGDEDADLSSTPQVSTVLDLPEGVTLHELDSPEELDPNDPHRLLDIKLDIPLEPELHSVKKAPAKKRVPRKATETSAAISSKQGVRNRERKTTKLSSVTSTEGAKAKHGEYLIFDSDRPSSSKEKRATPMVSTVPTTSHDLLLVPSPNANLSNDIDPWPQPPNGVGPTISEKEFIELLSSTPARLTGSAKAKVRCPAAAQAIAAGNPLQPIFQDLLSRIQREQFQVVESVDLNASVYAGSQAQPACLLLKLSAATGSLNIEVKATTTTSAEEYLQRTKRVAKSFKP
uniref:AP-3 complex subunit delta domain-containing protein n=2 Tax=Schistocephalus solidus TaxID=70667 RepID=A0A0X3P8N0_SCHSO